MIDNILNEIREERSVQDAKWGGPDNDDFHSFRDWVVIIIKHLGLAVTQPRNEETFRYQMLRVASLAIAAIEAMDRRKR